MVYETDDWVDVKLGEDEVFYFKTKSEQFRAAASAVLKAYMDQLVARIETAKVKG